MYININDRIDMNEDGLNLIIDNMVPQDLPKIKNK